MERHEILEAMTELKLYGMRASFDEIAGKGLARRDEIFPLLTSLIRAERIHRQARSISYRMSGARFPVLKDIAKFVFAGTPVDEGLVRELATGSFLDARRNVIFIGGTGTGKTHLCIGVAAAVVRTRAKGRFFNLVDLVNQLEQEKAAGRTGRLAEKLLRYDLIAIDELGYLPFSQPGGQLLFHLISKLYENTSLLITTNLTFADWPQVFGDARMIVPRAPPACRWSARVVQLIIAAGPDAGPTTSPASWKHRLSSRRGWKACRTTFRTARPPRRCARSAISTSANFKRLFRRAASVGTDHPSHAYPRDAQGPPAPFAQGAALRAWVPPMHHVDKLQTAAEKGSRLDAKRGSELEAI